MKFKVGDIVFVSNPDKNYRIKRTHSSFFGTITRIHKYRDGDCIQVTFPATNNGREITWAYNPRELSPINKLKRMRLDKFIDKYNVNIYVENVEN